MSAVLSAALSTLRSALRSAAPALPTAAAAELRRWVPAGPPAALRLLDSARGALQPPIRSEIFGPERLAQHGRSLGATHRATQGGHAAGAFFPRLRNNIGVLRQAHAYLALQAGEGDDISPATEWLLDNFHLIDAQLVEVHEGLPRRYFRSLPVLLDPPLAGLPRIYGVAWAFVAHTDSAFDEDLLVQFLQAYQDTRELKLSEVWALPTTLRVVLVENLRRLAEREAAGKAARELADHCAERSQSWSALQLDTLLGRLQQRAVAGVFLAQLWHRLQGLPTAADAPQAAPCVAWLGRVLPDPAALLRQQAADQTADNLSMSNAVGSLRAIGDAEWTDIIERTSLLVRLMFGAPSFEAEHPDTRSVTLHQLERLARRSGRSEREVAQALLDLMLSVPASERDAAVAVYWLDGAGRDRLLDAIGLHEPLRTRLRAAARWAALPVYLGTLLAGTGLLTLGLLQRYGVGESAPWTALAIALTLLPASETVVALINRLISESARPRRLPRLALAAGIPAEHRVLVVVPAMLTDPAAISGLLRRLQLHHLANPEPHAQFALLSDWTDADSATLPGDAALLGQAEALVINLNGLYPTDGAARFIVLHRQRRFSISEQRWIGWERKRGKLEQLISALATGVTDAFVDLGRNSMLAADVRYVVTLDSDTELPPGRLRELVGVAAHPINQPQLAADGASVVAGHGILQPLIVTPLPTPGGYTHFHGLFAGQCGIDPYSAATSEVYQDLFSEGSFSGKGLLHVQAMHSVLGQRLPEGRVLSHDLLEGSLLRCAAVSDITLIEDAPGHADVAASRVRRWTRGDWQLLPFLLQPGRWALRAVNRWKMLDNLRRSLVAPASLALLLLALLGHGLASAAALTLVLAAFIAGPLMGALAAFSPSRDDVALRHFYRGAGIDLLRALGAGLWHLVQLLHTARTALDAIGRALWRQFVSRRHLLQWSTAEAAQAQAGRTLSELLRQHRAEPLLALLLAAGLLAAGTTSPGLALALCLLWAASPLATWWVSLPRAARTRQALDAGERGALEGVARDSWRYFETTVHAGDHHLPPDNLQTSPHEMVAHRTSPTNIGLYLLSAACAREFGWITSAELVRRLQATLDTLARLQRHRGHFLNWYDTQSGVPLLPMYVSTVDSGNLCAHLLTVGQACLELARSSIDSADEALAPALRTLAERCESLAWEADFTFLYHRKRHLLHIGFRVLEQQLDGGLYDLLASESRLTSLLAIAKGDLPVRHWGALGRPFYAVGAVAGLRSWSGSMFEYLMPGLVLAEPEGSALHGACLAALREQMDYAADQGVPWGISESAYAGRDTTLAYQYSPQGVPRLALRRTPPHELVVAPYATALAAPLAARRALANFAALEDLGARGAYGYIEALDFSPSRQVSGELCARVETTMAHHQGMSIVALANLLLHGVAQRWGMANAHIEAVSSLLHERTPREVSVLRAPPPAPDPGGKPRREPGVQRLVLPGSGALEPTQVLGNGRYSVALRANGAGFSRHLGLGLTRWRDDALRDAYGSFFFLRWDQQPRPVSITQHPAPDPAATYQSVFHADRVCFSARWSGLQAHTTVWVSPEDDIEFRQVELHNLSERWLDVELLSSFEPTLCDDRADEAHPAFGKLFLRAEWVAALRALLFERKPRLAGEPALQLAHFVAETDPQLVSLQLQTDRQRWLGRNRDASRPLASFDLVPALPLASGLDTGLDPVCALALRLRIAPHGKASVTLATAAGEDSATLHAVIDKYRQSSHVQRASLMSATLAGIRLRELRLGADSLAAMQSISTALLLTLARPAFAAAALPPASDRRTLWRFGISGDRPLLLVSVGMLHGLALVRSLALALRWWDWAGIACDLVVLDTELTSYPMALQHELQALRQAHSAALLTAPGGACTGLFVLRQDELSADDRATLDQLARLRLQCDGRSLAQHVQAWLEGHEQAQEQRLATSTTALPVRALAADGAALVSGEFEARGAAFVFEVGAQRRPARPWINVLANPGFGAQLSEAGGGYTWAQNSRLLQLTAWSNDPVADPAAEWLLLQDLDSRQVWSLCPSSAGDRSLGYQVRHGHGTSQVSHRRGALEVVASWCVDIEHAVKQVQVRLVNHGNSELRLRLVGVAEWALGAGRSDRRSVHTVLFRQRLGAATAGDAGPGSKLSALLATQTERAAGLGGSTAFLAVVDDSGTPEDWTCDRRELFDARGQAVLPDHFGQRSGAGLDPCAALSVPVQLAPGQALERCFLLGHGATPEAARELATRAAAVPPSQRLAQVTAQWDRLLGAIEVKTPDPLFDALVNRWLLYQTVACRLWAKAGLYQAGGATGFRDQLQDAVALAWAAPQLLRDQIVLTASRQFAEGDVQHWWHSPGGAGVRTHSSDDLLWLPYACTQYLNSSSDATLLDQPVPFLQGADIPPGAEDLYQTPTVGSELATVYEHAARTLDRSLRVGLHGLPLIGSGDWNDGMNRVGHQGRGESVWLAWFLCALVQDWAALARTRGDVERARQWEQAAVGWKAALQGPAWDGQWFKRAFFDDGQALGGHDNAEARIDLIAQAWAVLSDAAPREQQAQAMRSVDEHLVDAGAGLIRLLDPPLVRAEPSAGYIQAYPPGVRENGGQYSHGAIWALMARAAQATRAGATAEDDRVYRDFTWLSPAHRSRHPTQGPAYGLEPYVMAGDICTQPPWVGRGGWSWYTGAAGWLHRAAIEAIFGLRLQAGSLHFRPCLPSHWPRADLTLRRDGCSLHFEFVRAGLPALQEQALATGARLLQAGESLAWSGSSGHQRFLVALPETRPESMP